MNEIKRQLNARIGDTSERANRVQRQVNRKINQSHVIKKVQWGYYAVIIAFIGVLIFCINLIPSTFNEEIVHLTKQPHATETLLPPTEDDEDIILQGSPGQLTKIEGELSIQESKTAYEMCVRVLTDYYKAVWNGSDIDLDLFIDNENLKQYMKKKIHSQYDLYSAYTDSNDEVQYIEIDTWEVEFTDDEFGGFLYLKLPAEVKKTVGSYGEVTEFLVRNVNDKLVIVDWYTGARDSYDFMVRGENLTIDNPNIWNDSEWVKKLNSKQNNFSGSTR